MDFHYKIPGVILFSYKELNSHLVDNLQALCDRFIWSKKVLNSHCVALAVWPRLAPI